MERWILKDEMAPLTRLNNLFQRPSLAPIEVNVMQPTPASLPGAGPTAGAQSEAQLLLKKKKKRKKRKKKHKETNLADAMALDSEFPEEGKQNTRIGNEDLWQAGFVATSFEDVNTQFAASAPPPKRRRVWAPETKPKEPLTPWDGICQAKTLALAVLRDSPDVENDPAEPNEDDQREMGIQQANNDQSTTVQNVSLSSGPAHQPGLQRWWLADNQRPVDHMGTPLSDEAIAVAQEYWRCQREYDFCPCGAVDGLQGPQPAVHPLLRMARARRKYTTLVLELDELEPGSRTYEPPYMELELESEIKRELPSVLTEASEAGPPLCPEQAALLELAGTGKNFFYTGSAGCGKSTTLHALVKYLKEQKNKNVKVLAPTGQAALAVGGTTTWSFAGWTPDHHKYKLLTLKLKATAGITSRRFRKTHVIIIDEISMVENLHFERLSEAMKSGRGDDRPFGGVQVIVTGDFCQLPPVKPFRHCITCGSELLPSLAETLFTCPKGCPGSPYKHTDKWAFRSKAWEDCNFMHVHLETIHRQKDTNFIRMLQKCRLGYEFTPDEIALLMERRAISSSAAHLFPMREQVAETNRVQFERLETPVHSYDCRDLFIWNAHPHLAHKGECNPDGSLRALDDHRLERRLELKKGMRVVLLVNLDLSLGLCNGSQGIVCGFAEHDPHKLPRKRGKSEIFQHEDGAGLGLRGSYAALMEREIRAFAKQVPAGSLVWPMVRFNNGIVMTIYPECQVNELGDNEPYSLLCRTQIPLTAAWALTIHKSQGMTLDRVVVDLNRSWEDGQVYVALSRARSLEGLRIEGTGSGLNSAVLANAEVRRFFREKFPAVTMKAIIAAEQES